MASIDLKPLISRLNDPCRRALEALLNTRCAPSTPPASLRELRSSLLT